MKLTFCMDSWYNNNFCDLNMKGIDALYWKCCSLIDRISVRFVHDDEQDYLVEHELRVIKDTLEIAKDNKANLESVNQKDNFVEITLSFPNCKDEDAFIEQNSKQVPVITCISIPLSQKNVFRGGRGLVEVSAHFFYYGSEESQPNIKAEYENAWRVVRATQTSQNNMLVYSSYNEKSKELELFVRFINADAYKAFLNNYRHI